MTAREIPQHVLDELPPDREVARLRIPPHSIESESSVLGGLLQDNGAWDRIGDMLAERDFYRHEHQIIFGAITALVNASKPADVITVYEHLERAGNGETVGGLPYLNSLAQYVVSAANIRRYAEIVRERAILRRLVATSDEIAAAAFNPEGKTVEAIVDAAQQMIIGIGETTGAARDDWEEPDVAMVAFLDGLQRRADGERDFLPTGLADIDEKLDGGVREGEVIVIAARPSMGKTALALSIGENMAEAGASVGVLSMEMARPQVHNRRVAMHSRVPLHKIKRPERMSDFDWGEMTRAVDKMRRLPVSVSDQPGLNINQVRTKARSLKRRRGLRVLIVDYIGLMEGTDRKANRATQLGEVSRALKGLAKDLGMTVLLLAQLNREVEKRPGMRPIMADLRECGDIEQDADVILFVHRAYHVKPDLGPEGTHHAEIIIGKQRDGVSGASVPLWFAGDVMRFSDWPRETPIPSSPVQTKGREL